MPHRLVEPKQLFARGEGRMLKVTVGSIDLQVLEEVSCIVGKVELNVCNRVQPIERASQDVQLVKPAEASHV